MIATAEGYCVIHGLSVMRTALGYSAWPEGMEQEKSWRYDELVYQMEKLFPKHAGHIAKGEELLDELPMTEYLWGWYFVPPNHRRYGHFVVGHPWNADRNIRIEWIIAVKMNATDPRKECEK